MRTRSPRTPLRPCDRISIKWALKWPMRLSIWKTTTKVVPPARCLVPLDHASRMVAYTFVASRVELKRMKRWRNIRGAGITIEEAKQLVCMTNSRLKREELNLFDWERTDSDQGIFDTKMIVFLWFKEGVTPIIRKKVLNDIQHGLASDPLSFKGVNVRATLELDPLKRPWNEALMKEHANVSREAFDIRWVDTGLRVSIGGDPAWETCPPDRAGLVHHSRSTPRLSRLSCWMRFSVAPLYP